MKFSLLSALSATLALALALPQVEPASRAAALFDREASVATITWTGTIDKQGTNVTLEGTPEQVLSEIKRMNPDFEDLEDEEEEEAGHDSTEKPKLQARGGALCNVGYTGYGEGSAVRAGIKTLNALGKGKSTCQVGPGPAKCTRFTCSWNTGIWLCNDNRKTLTIRCKSISEKAQQILNQCSANLWGDDKVRGQMFSPGSWNVVAAADDNHKC